MKKHFNEAIGFTLLELLLVMLAIAVLAALVFPALARAKTNSQRATCLSNLRQISLGVRMYAEDFDDAFPPATNRPPASFTAYTQLMKSYVSVTGSSPTRAKLFACPADTFFWDDVPVSGRPGWTAEVRIAQSLHSQSKYYYSSYAFNGGNFLSGKPAVARYPGIAGRKLSSVRHPAKTVLVTEFTALVPFSWHAPGSASHYNNALNGVSFVDGHVSFIKMYWNEAQTNGVEAWHYDPPANYDYIWSGD